MLYPLSYGGGSEDSTGWPMARFRIVTSPAVESTARVRGGRRTTMRRPSLRAPSAVDDEAVPGDVAGFV